MTRSKVVQTVVRSTYQTFQDQDLKRNIALAVAVCCVGFATGLLAYSITILVAWDRKQLIAELYHYVWIEHNGKIYLILLI